MSMLARLFSSSRDVVGINRRNVELVYAHNPRASYRFADDKLLTKKVLQAAGVPVPETLVVCEGLHDIAVGLERLRTLEQFVIKPASSSGGQGIVVVAESIGDGRWRKPSGVEIDLDALRQHLASIVFGAFGDDLGDCAFVEPRVVSHPLLHALWSEALSDIRVITLDAQPLMAMLRVPTKRSDGRANLHQGALGLALDLESGAVFRAVYQGESIERHPDSGQLLIGLTLPNWSDILDVARRAARAIPLGYLGVDLVLDDQDRAFVLEVNARPGLEIQNVNGRGLGHALAAFEAKESSR